MPPKTTKAKGAEVGAAWLAKLEKAKATCMNQGGRKKLHFTFEEGAEMVEEWELNSGTLAVRKFRSPSTLGGSKAWDYEVGEEVRAAAPSAEGAGAGLFVSASNPVCVRKDSKAEFQWRIRNLPYGLDVYSLTVSEDENEMVLRTSNKKYFKKLRIPDLERIGVTLDADACVMAHANNTLIISYTKPPTFLAFEKRLHGLRDKMKAGEEGDVDCASQ